MKSTSSWIRLIGVSVFFIQFRIFVGWPTPNGVGSLKMQSSVLLLKNMFGKMFFVRYMLDIQKEKWFGSGLCSNLNMASAASEGEILTHASGYCKVLIARLYLLCTIHVHRTQFNTSMLGSQPSDFFFQPGHVSLKDFRYLSMLYTCILTQMV